MTIVLFLQHRYKEQNVIADREKGKVSLWRGTLLDQVYILIQAAFLGDESKETENKTPPEDGIFGGYLKSLIKHAEKKLFHTDHFGGVDKCCSPGTHQAQSPTRKFCR